MGSFRRLLGLPLEVGRSAGNVFYVQAVKNAAGDIVERRTVGIDLDRSALTLRTPRLSLFARPDSHSRYALRPFARSNTTGSRARRNSWGKRQRYPQGGKCGYMGVAI